jgi:hypothetical protein
MLQYLRAGRPLVCSAVMVSGDRRRASAPPIHTHIWQCPQFYPSPSPSLVYFSYTFCCESEGSLAMSGQCGFDLRIFSLPTVDSASSEFCSNLSGLFLLLDPLSSVGLLIAQVVGHIPYLLLGFTWGLSKKHEGTDA